MPSAAYKYVSDNGTTYQVVLPSDFATALGYTAAAGTETYLPVYIAPRYATYVSAASQIQISVVITNRFTFSAPPPTVTVAGVNYSLAGAFGEKRTGLPLGQLITIAGPQGAQGPPGQDATITTLYNKATQDTALSNASLTSVVDLGVPAAGDWIFFGNVQFQCGSGQPTLSASIRRGASATVLGANSIMPFQNVSNNYFNVATMAYAASMNGTDHVYLYAYCSTGSGSVRYRNAANEAYATQIWGQKI